MYAIQQLLDSISPLLRDSKTKLLRHADSREEYKGITDYKSVMKDPTVFLEYQAVQSNASKVGESDYIVTFVGMESTKALFVGVFKVEGKELINNQHHYKLTKVEEFNDLECRIIIEWGSATTVWAQHYNNEKEIIQILPKGSQGYLGEFPGLTSFILSYEELEVLIRNQHANMDWKAHLSAVSGVYLILDNTTGNQYIGSAYGQGGIWQRWESYVNDPTGGNILLKQLKEQRPDFHNQLSFTLIEALPNNYLVNDVTAIEQLYKKKLGTKVFGLNAN
jgi:hypothetical protein